MPHDGEAHRAPRPLLTFRSLTDLAFSSSCEKLLLGPPAPASPPCWLTAAARAAAAAGGAGRGCPLPLALAEVPRGAAPAAAPGAGGPAAAADGPAAERGRACAPAAALAPWAVAAAAGAAPAPTLAAAPFLAGGPPPGADSPARLALPLLGALAVPVTRFTCMGAGSARPRQGGHGQCYVRAVYTPGGFGGARAPLVPEEGDLSWIAGVLRRRMLNGSLPHTPSDPASCSAE